MNYYLRKMYPHDITHEVSVTTEIVNAFFDGRTSFLMKGKTSFKQGTVTINSATDPRFGGAFKSLLLGEGEAVIGDIVLIEKKGIYQVELIKKTDPRFSLLDSFFTANDRHAIIYAPTSATSVTSSTRENGGINKIYYGAPGCGKSKQISDKLKLLEVDEKHIIRVTFHPEYSNSDFIGQILPTVDITADSDGGTKEIVRYVFNPGPLTIAINTALNTNEMVYLVIEELNRGNAAAIFGDMFQLLDREKHYLPDGSPNPLCGQSEYPVCNPNMQKYLMDHVTEDSIRAALQIGIFIPSNLTIYATMNSSDQNVFTLDTAFKRRWSFVMVPNDITSDTTHPYKAWYIPGTSISWESFLVKINDCILKPKINNQTNEDKRMGKYFVTRECLTQNIENIANVEEQASAFAYKVLEYIWNDVCKMGRDEWFDVGTYKTLEDLINAFVHPNDGKPLSVFQNIVFD